jgi:hypothetical protein
MPAALLEVETGSVGLDPARRDRVDVTFAQQDVRVAMQVDLGALLRVEKYAIADRNRPYVRSDGNRLGPGEPPTDRRGRRDEDAGRRAPFAVADLDTDEDTVV